MPRVVIYGDDPKELATAREAALKKHPGASIVFRALRRLAGDTQDKSETVIIAGEKHISEVAAAQNPKGKGKQ